MLLHWLTAGWRSLIANPLFTLITVASLSIGCCGALLAGANIKQHLSFERWVPDAERILLLRQHFPAGPPRAPGEEPPLAKAENFIIPPMLDLLQQKIGGIEAQARLMPGGYAPSEEADQPASRIAMIDPAFIDMFGLRFIDGDPRTALSVKNGLVLTESEARKRLGPGPWAGRHLRKGETGPDDTIVAGVVEDLPAASYLKTDGFWTIGGVWEDVNASGQKDARTDWKFFVDGQHFIKVKEGVNVKAFIATAQKEIGVLAREASGFDGGFALVPLLDLHLAGRETTGFDSGGELTMLVTLGTAAAALLLVSGFNYVTLSLARSLRRRHEVAVRKALGARQSSLISQYLAESLIVTAISLLAGFGLAVLLSPWFARALGQDPELFNLYDPVFIGGSVIAGLAFAAAVGAYPAFYLAHVRPRAGLDSGAAAALGRVSRGVSRALLFFQIAAATVLLVIAVTMGAQSQYIGSRPLGFTMANMHSVPSPCTLPPAPPTNEQLAALHACDARFLDFVRKAPGVEQASSGSTFQLFAAEARLRSFSRPGINGEAVRSMRIDVETDFLQMMGARLLAGRFFDDNSAFDRQLLDQTMVRSDPVDRVPIIVTQSVLPLVSTTTPEEAIGKTLIPQTGSIKALEIVGVVEDWHRRSLRHSVEPIIFTPGGAQMQMVARIDSGRVNEMVDWLRKTWREAGADLNAASVYIDATSIEDTIKNAYADDQRLVIAVAGFAAVSIAVAGLGVFGLSAFDMRRRVREIGIRKALGASPGGVAGMVVRRQMAFAAIASVLSWPLGWWIANEWLSGYVYRTALGLAALPVASLIVIAFVLAAVGLNALRAAAVRPSEALRTAT